MGYLVVHCEYCSMTWNVHRNRDEPHGHICPHCAHKVKDEVMQQAYRALKTMEDVNFSAFADHVDNHNTLFTFDFVADHIFQPQRKDCD